MSAPRMSRKLHLGLRTTALEKEIAQKKFSKDLAVRLKGFEERAEDSAGNMYDDVLDFVDMQTRFGSFWKEDGCASLVEWLARRNLPSGTTLANREILVRLFDRETFVKVRDDALGEMTFLVSKFQTDSELRRRDYQGIFDAYMKANDAFDKREFCKIVYWYVNVTYKPKGSDPKNNTARPPRAEPKGSTSQKVARPNESEENAAEMPRDFVVETRPCACGWREYALECESIIHSELGAKRLPKRPQGLL